MPAAVNKKQLITVCEKEYGKLAGLLYRMDEDLAAKPFSDGISIKDTIGHRAHWIDLFLGWYADGQAGRKVFFPAQGYKWNQLKEYNTKLRQEQAKLDWKTVRKMLSDGHKRLMAFLDSKANAELYGGPMKGANNDWTPGRWAEASGASHYRSAAKYVRKCLREAGV